MDAMCANHPDVEAVGECTWCKKPVCASCLVRGEGGVYCSRECAETARKRGREIHKKVEKNIYRPKLLKRLIAVIAVAAVVYLLLKFLGNI